LAASDLVDFLTKNQKALTWIGAASQTAAGGARDIKGVKQSSWLEISEIAAGSVINDTRYSSDTHHGEGPTVRSSLYFYN
jgi:hypothetical protein